MPDTPDPLRTAYEVVSKRTGEVWLTTTDPHHLNDWVTKDNFILRPATAPQVTDPRDAARRAAIAHLWAIKYGPVPDDDEWREMVRLFEQSPHRFGWTDTFNATDAAIAAWEAAHGR